MSTAATTPRYAIKRYTGSQIAHLMDTLLNVSLKPYDLSRPGQERSAEQHAQRLNAALERRAAVPREPVPEPVELSIVVDGVSYVRRTTAYRAELGHIVRSHSYFVGPRRVPITERVSWHEVQKVEQAIREHCAAAA